MVLLKLWTPCEKIPCMLSYVYYQKESFFSKDYHFL